MPVATDRRRQNFLAARTIDRPQDGSSRPLRSAQTGPPVRRKLSGSVVRIADARLSLATADMVEPGMGGAQRHEGSGEMTGEACAFRFSRPRPGVFLVRMEGYDRGELGQALFERIEAEISQVGAIELFVDTRAAHGSVTTVRESWTQWFARRRGSLLRVHLLAGTRFLRVTMDITKQLSRTGDLIVVHYDEPSFDAALARAAGRGHAAAAAQ
jgi:hypothetical protein